MTNAEDQRPTSGVRGVGKPSHIDNARRIGSGRYLHSPCDTYGMARMVGGD